MPLAQSPEVKAVFDTYAPSVRARLVELRALILATAAKTEGVGALCETLKWGEPAYLPVETKIGTTIRIGPLKGDPSNYCLFFNCQTNLVETFRHWFPPGQAFEGNRALVFNVADPLPREAAADCIAAALTYHLAKRQPAPAWTRNRRPIAEVLGAHLPARGVVLEVASGPGQHVVFFAQRFRQLTWQPTEVDVERLGSISARIDEAGQPNLLAPLQLDVASPVWPVSSADALVCINLLHISPWGCCGGLFAGAARTLSAGGLAYVYGPFKVDGRHTSEGNAAFDARLRERDPALGLREVADVERQADAHGFDSLGRVSMPANNLSLVFRRRSAAR